MELFQVSCTTCKAKLRVNDLAAIGQIVACPKCRSMVMVSAPAGWAGASADQTPSAASTLPPVSSTPSSPSTFDELPDLNAVAPQPQAPAKTVRALAVQPQKPAELPLPRSGSHDATASGGELAPPPVVTSPTDWYEPTEHAGRRWLLVGGVGATILVVAATIWSLRGEKSAPPQAAVPPAVAPAAAPAEPASPVEPAPVAAPAALDPRWLPDDTRIVLGYAPSTRQTAAPLAQWLARVAPVWHTEAQSLLEALTLRSEQVARLTFAGNAFGDLNSGSLLIVDLVEPLPAAAWHNHAPTVAGLALNQQTARQFDAAVWPHPIVQVGERTLLSAPRATIEHLAARGAPQPVVPRVIDLAQRGHAHALALAVDLLAWREAGLPAPPPEMALLVAHVPAWHALGQMPTAGAAWFDVDPTVRVEARLIVDNESTAQQLLVAWQQAVAQTRDLAAAQAGSLDDQLKAGTLALPAADHLEVVLGTLIEALNTSTAGQEADEFWATVHLNRPAPELFAAVLGSVPAWEADRQRQIRAGDVAAQRAVWQGIAARQRAEGAFPMGAGGAAQLRPESRLSWIASLLPYYGHRDWHRELSFFRSWNDPVNRPVAMRPLLEMANPAFGPTTSDAGFPTTHYAGLAGLGEDAGNLPADHPRAGLFGFGREVRRDQLVDGASSTIALVGVAERQGPWAAGGLATVRPFTQAPYVNGPDGLGSGQSDGMYVVMADGSVRFLSTSVDPHVVEQLATINGGASAVDLTTVPPVDARGQVVLAPRAEQPAAAPAPASPAETELAAEVAVVPPVDPAADEALAARLAFVLPHLELRETPLGQFLDLIADMAGASVSLDLDALTIEGIAVDDPVSIKLANVSLAQALTAALDTLGLAYVLDGGQVLVTTPARLATELVVARYDVAPLIDAGDATLVALIERFVVPGAWQSSGGAGTLSVADGQLTASQTPAGQRELTDFLARLAAARLGQAAAPGVIAPELQARLDAPVTVNFAEPTPLARVLADLQTAGGVNLVVDHRALAAAGVGREAETTLQAQALPLAEALDQALAPLELTTRPIDARTLEITTRAAAQAALVTEFHPVPPGLVAASGPDELLMALRREVASDTWRSAGGAGDIVYDQASRSLLVLHNADVQAQVRAWLAAPR